MESRRSHYINDTFYEMHQPISSWARHRGEPTLGSLWEFLAQARATDVVGRALMFTELRPWQPGRPVNRTHPPAPPGGLD